MRLVRHMGPTWIIRVEPHSRSVSRDPSWTNESPRGVWPTCSSSVLHLVVYMGISYDSYARLPMPSSCLIRLILPYHLHHRLIRAKEDRASERDPRRPRHSAPKERLDALLLCDPAHTRGNRQCRTARRRIRRTRMRRLAVPNQPRFKEFSTVLLTLASNITRVLTTSNGVEIPPANPPASEPHSAASCGSGFRWFGR